MGAKTIKIVVSSGQYEKSAKEETVTYTTIPGLCRRLRQLSKTSKVYGDNWAGWIPAQVAIADPDDRWGDNTVANSVWCEPAKGWFMLDGDEYGRSLSWQVQRVLAGHVLTNY